MKLDNVTGELPGIKPLPKTNAERSRAKRERLQAEGKKQISVTISLEVLAGLEAYVKRQNADVADNPITLGDAVEKALRDRFLRKR
ncbi:hypothetical protein [Massilia sp. SYSU DXS3249]